MSDEITVPAPITPPPRSALWKWTKRIGCALVLLALTCCGTVCTGAWWLDRSVANINKDEVDRLHAQGLHHGDLEAIHKNADDRFRKKITLDDLRALVQKHPNLFDRDRLQGVEFVREKIDGIDFVKVRSRRTYFPMDMHEVIFKIVDGVYRLVGISPGMDEFAPDNMKFKAPRRRRHRWWD